LELSWYGRPQTRRPVDLVLDVAGEVHAADSAHEMRPVLTSSQPPLPASFTVCGLMMSARRP
jgi:hypothetical protein